jgi:hypothetical protein
MAFLTKAHFRRLRFRKVLHTRETRHGKGLLILAKRSKNCDTYAGF